MESQGEPVMVWTIYKKSEGWLQQECGVAWFPGGLVDWWTDGLMFTGLRFPGRLGRKE